MNSAGPRAYVSPDQVTTSPDRVGHTRPWMKPLPGESESDRMARCHFLCYRCGHHEADLAVLAEHEDACQGA